MEIVHARFIYTLRLLAAIDALADGYPSSSNGPDYDLHDAFGVIIREVNPTSFSDKILSVHLDDIPGISTDEISLQSFPGSSASITLPGTLFDGLNLGSEATIVYYVFLNESLFLRREDYLERQNRTSFQLGSIVLAGHVVGEDRVNNLAQPVTLTFQKNEVSQSP